MELDIKSILLIYQIIAHGLIILNYIDQSQNLLIISLLMMTVY